MPLSLRETDRGDKQTAVAGCRFSVHVSVQELLQRDVNGVPAENPEPITKNNF